MTTKKWTKKRVDNAEKKLARDAELARLASNGQGGYEAADQHKPMKWRPFASISIKL